MVVENEGMSLIWWLGTQSPSIFTKNGFEHGMILLNNEMIHLRECVQKDQLIMACVYK